MGEGRRLVVTGATGMIGRALSRRLVARGDRLVVLSRDPAAAARAVPGAAGYAPWPPDERGGLQAIDGADGVVHLAASPIAGRRWDDAYMREIMESRAQGTRAVIDAIARVGARPKVLVSASGVDYYGDRGDQTVTEADGPGSTFLARVAEAWEREALRAETLGVRTCVMRTGIVLDKKEGALGRLLLPFMLGAGGPVLPGTQWWSWVHLDDVVGLFELALDDSRARGGLNVTAPEPVRQREFAATLGRVLHRPAIAPTPIFAVELLVGKMARPLLVEKQRAVPARALELGYRFAHPQLEGALRATLRG